MLQYARPFVIFAVAAGFAACGPTSLSPQAAAVPLVKGSSAPTARIVDELTGSNDRSGILPEARRDTLVYTSDIILRKVFVLSVRTGKLVGTLKLRDIPDGLCSDRNGHVFVTHYSLYGHKPGTVDEYDHGATRPIASMKLPIGGGGSCAVDPLTGDLAVTSGNGAYTVSIFSPPFQNHAVPPTFGPLYTLEPEMFDAYDNAGNLFLTTNSISQGSNLVELPAGGDQLVPISRNPNKRFDGGTIQWFRDYLVVSISPIQHVRISGAHLNVISEMQLQKQDPLQPEDGQSWISNGHFLAVFSCLARRRDRCDRRPDKVGFWSYPDGKLLKTFHGFGALFLEGVTVSAPQEQ